MRVAAYDTVREMAEAAARLAGEELSRRIAETGHATFMAATGASLSAFLDALTRRPHLDHPQAHLFLDADAASLPDKATLDRWQRPVRQTERAARDCPEDQNSGSST